jgi:dihydroorotase (multifunctional complex type)
VDLVIKNGKVVTHSETVSAAIGIDKGKVVAIAPEGFLPSAGKVIDAGGKYVLPGAIDLHTHMAYGEYFNIPFSQTVLTETGAAALGGVTTAAIYLRRVKTGLLTHIDDLKRDFEANSYIDGFFHMMVADEANLEQIEKAPDYGIYGFKFMMGYKGPQAEALGIPAIDDGFVLDGFRRVSKLGFPSRGMVHAENIDIVLRLRKTIEAQGRQDARAWFDTRPNFVEEECIHRAIFLAKVSGCPLYIVHNTIKESVDIISRAKAEGINVVMETCPQYLTHNSEQPVPVIKENPVFANVNPPLRGKEDNERLWEGIRDGVIDTIASDHVSVTRELKGKDMWKAPMGIGNATQMILPVMISEGVNKNRIPLEKVAEVCSYNPARVFGFYPRKGTIAVGSDADLAIVDLEKKVKFTSEMSTSLCDWSIWEGWEFKGFPVGTIIRGEVVVEDSKLVGKPGYGRYLFR